MKKSKNPEPQKESGFSLADRMRKIREENPNRMLGKRMNRAESDDEEDFMQKVRRDSLFGPKNIQDLDSQDSEYIDIDQDNFFDRLREDKKMHKPDNGRFVNDDAASDPEDVYRAPDESYQDRLIDDEISFEYLEGDNHNNNRRLLVNEDLEMIRFKNDLAFVFESNLIRDEVEVVELIMLNDQIQAVIHEGNDIELERILKDALRKKLDDMLNPPYA